MGESIFILFCMIFAIGFFGLWFTTLEPTKNKKKKYKVLCAKHVVKEITINQKAILDSSRCESCSKKRGWFS